MRSKLERLKDNAWDIWSEYIRTRDKGTCYTCQIRYWDEELGDWSIRGFNAGHFKHGVLDFDEENIHCQCVRCNKYYSGKLDVYAENLLRDLGIKKFTALCNRAKQATKGNKLTEEDYEKIIRETKTKLNKLKGIVI